MSDITVLDRLEAIPEPVPTANFVVVDVIISSTSIIRLLEEGAAYVKPFGDPDNARQFKRNTEDAILVGEDGGGPIEGFDLSPLPSIIGDAEVAGRPVGIRTSNGTRAMDKIGTSEGIFVGSTINANAVAGVLAERDRDPIVVAAGRQGEPVDEDSVGAELIEKHYRGEQIDEKRLRERIRNCSTAQWLRNIGFEHELDALLAFDSTDTVPKLVAGRFVDAADSPREGIGHQSN